MNMSTLKVNNLNNEIIFYCRYVQSGTTWLARSLDEHTKITAFVKHVFWKKCIGKLN